MTVLMFLAFIAMLLAFLFSHHHRYWAVGIGFGTLSFLFLLQHGFGGYAHHLGEGHRLHLLLNLAALLPGFAVVAHHFETSGASDRLSKVIRSDALLLLLVFVLSTFLDNIAAAMIGGTILQARYGLANAPFKMIVGVIAASNLGGAGSPIGDTTTVMLFVAGVPVLKILPAFIATIPAHVLLTLWATHHHHVPLSESIVPGEEQPHGHPANWRQLFPLLGIPGLIVGNLFDQPGIGLWSGMALGCLLGRLLPSGTELLKALPNTAFLVALVATAELLPLDAVKPWLDANMTRDQIAVALGVLSPWFDNIPLTAVALSLGGFDWGLLAYTVGYGGSCMWFGSSAGVAVGVQFKEVYETRRWLVPFFVLTGIYFAGVAAYMGVMLLFR